MHLFSLVDASIGRSGVCGKEDSPPISPAVSSMVGIYPLVFSFVLQGASSNTLYFRKNIKGSAPFLGVTLQLFMSDVFGGGPKVISKIDDHLCASWWVYSVQSSQWYPLLLPGCCPSDHFSLAAFLRDLACPLVPCATGASEFLEGMPSQMRVMSWEVFSLPSGSVVL